MPHHLIFEGAELAGKSWLMSRVYDFLEPKYNKNNIVLDGCHWFNCDVGIFGTKHGKPILNSYLQILEELSEKNIILEKFHLSDTVYKNLHHGKNETYANLEKKLQKLNYKIVLVTFPEDKEIIKGRIKDRLKLYPHYERILRDPAWYIEQQRGYIKEIEKTKLPYIIIKTSQLPDEKIVKKVLKWLKEK